ncbi:MAG: hypothetical protein IT373_18795 [Polyangiaceae bacterium]|nr:hypothetical protein [Polyangiaceae bacterium]
MLKTGGHGTVSDCELVADELARLPVYVIERVRRHGIKVVVCRGDVTDYRHDLEGVEPRNWPGQTWADATGAGGEDECTIAVVGHDTRTGAHVPEAGEGHGSQSVVIHELFHCIDDNEGAPSSSDHSFWEARANDYGRLSEYERQAGEGGPQETYAESAARYFGQDDEDARRRPHMHSYWESEPLRTK